MIRKDSSPTADTHVVPAFDPRSRGLAWGTRNDVILEAMLYAQRHGLGGHEAAVVIADDYIARTAANPRTRDTHA